MTTDFGSLVGRAGNRARFGLIIGGIEENATMVFSQDLGQR
jgi:hypothetical protein